MNLSDKKLVIDAIIKKKEASIRKHDRYLKKAEESSSFAHLYGLLAETLGSTIEFDTLKIQILKNNLQHEFFHTAVVRADNGFIVFSNDDFEVMFSKTLNKTIKVKYKKAGFYLQFASVLKDATFDIEKLLDRYLQKRSIKNLKKLAQYNKGRYDKNLVATFMCYIDTWKSATQENLDFIRQRIRNEELRKKKIEENNKEYEEGQIFAKAFFDSIWPDLEQFEAIGWQIEKEGIASRPSAKNT